MENKSSKKDFSNIMAKIALGLGILKLIFFKGGLGDIAFVFAIIFGILALATNKSKNKNTRGLAVLGIILALAGIVVKVLMEA